MSFMLFPELPAELRALIWQAAGAPENQAIDYRWVDDPEGFPFMRITYDGGLSYHNADERVGSVTRHLGTLSACRESRKETIRHFPDHLDWKVVAEKTAAAALAWGNRID